MGKTEWKLVDSAVKKLGPERCRAALVAFAEYAPGSYKGCVLARAYGPPGALQDAYRERVGPCWETVPAVLGLTRPEVSAVCEAYDRKPDTLLPYFQVQADQC